MNILEIIDLYRSDSSALVNIQFIVWALIIGFIISFFAAYYKKNVIGSFVRALREAEAFDPESAKTLAELDQEDNVSAIAAIRKSASLRRMITICNENEPANGKILIDENTRFYIPESAQARSLSEYGEKAESILPILLGSLALIGVGIIAFFIGK